MASPAARYASDNYLFCSFREIFQIENAFVSSMKGTVAIICIMKYSGIIWLTVCRWFSLRIETKQTMEWEKKDHFLQCINMHVRDFLKHEISFCIKRVFWISCLFGLTMILDEVICANRLASINVHVRLIWYSCLPQFGMWFRHPAVFYYVTLSFCIGRF